MAAGLQTRVKKSDAVKRIDILTLSILCSDAPDAPGHSTQYSCLSEVASSEYLGIKDTVNHCWPAAHSWPTFQVLVEENPGSDRCSRMDQNVGLYFRHFPTFSDIFRHFPTTSSHVLLPSGCCLRDKRATCHTKQTLSREKCQLHRPLVSIP